MDETESGDGLEVEPATASEHDANRWAAAARAAASGDTATVTAATAPDVDPVAVATTWSDFDDDSPLPPRRARTFTPLTGLLAAALLTTGGFAAGAKVGRSSAPKAAVASPAAAAAAFGTGRQGGAGAAGAAGATTTVAGQPAGRQGAAGATGQAPTGAGGFGGGTFGTVKLVDGTNVYIQDASGNVVKVSTSTDSVITVTKRGAATDLKAGDTVVVQGTADGDGNIAATAITSTNGLAIGRNGGQGQAGAGAATPSTTVAGAQRPASGPTTTAKG